ncbi:glycosyl transferase family protein [Pseudomonas saudiphocaensis]|uniref:Glycosyl transferase family protein n=2 Tax=Pseudomonas saudiphocaensis TaxID=1499686 RepID=A0A078LMU3_9PSED|nr:glycosyl transferase family protein [Pseudomonas saudiphocaensis]
MMSGVPVVSVFMLTYNHGRFIAEAIESVLAQEMDYAFELVIGDDASTDDTRLICERYAREYPDTIRYIRNAQNLGGSENGRQVLAACRGRYLARLEGDDYMVGRRRLNDQVAWLEQHPDCMLVYGRARVIDASKTVLSEIPHLDRCFSGDLLEGMLEGNLIPACTAVYRAEILTQLPEWRSHVRYGDYLANTIAADKGKIHCFPEVLAVYRRHADSMTARDQYHTNLIELIDIHCRFITHNDLSLRGIALSRQAIIQKLHKLKRYSLETGQVINWTELKDMVTPCLEPGTSEAADASLLFGEQDDSVDSGYVFSVILTTYNRPDLLRDALASVGNQSFRDFEVILINDNGEPVEHLLGAYDFPITYIRQGRNRGLSAARNAGLALARGRYVVYLDDDDIYLPDHLAVLAEAFERHPRSVVYTGVEYVNERLEDGRRIELGRSQPFKHETFDRDRLFVQNYIPVNTWAHPREMLAEVGEFDVGLAAFEDWDMLLRLATRYPFVHVPAVTSEVHARAPGAGGDHMLGRERKNFPALYRELYQRYAGSASETLQSGRQQMLERLGVPVDKGDEAPDLDEWLAARLPTEVQSRLISERLEQAQGGVVLGVVVVDADGDQDALIATVRSLGNDRHLYASVKIVALTTLDAPATGWEEKLHYVRLDQRGLVEQVNDVVGSLQADWFMLVQAGSVFTQSGLMVAALDLLAAPDCRAVYGDELLLQDNGTLGVALRPGLNLDMLLSLPGVMARHWLFNRPLWQQSGGFDLAAGQAFELDYILRLILDRGLEGMGHISEPLLKGQAPLLTNCLDERDVIIRHLNARGYEQADVSATIPGHYEISYGHPQLAKVSILVSANDGLAKIRRCVESVLEKTSYPAYEVLILDHAVDDSAMANWLLGVEQLGTSAVKVVRLPQGLSIAQGQNLAAQQATGDYLLWLDSGVGVLSESWLHALMNHGLRPEVGAVGAKLITGDSKVASGGIVLGFNGPIGHVGCGQPLDAPGYLQRLLIDQNHTALSGKCLLLRRALFVELGGFDETPEMAPWTDVDLCLRLYSAGYFNVWTPRSPLLITAGAPLAATPEQEEALYARWLPLLARDPVYNPNFKLDDEEEFVLAPSLLSWNPLASWKPLPRVLAHPADRFGCGHYRVIKPLNALNREGGVDGTFAWGHLSLTELERFAPDTIVLQRQIDAVQIEGMRQVKAFSNAFKVYELDDYLPNLPLKSVHRDQMPKDILRSLRKGLGFVDRFVVSTEPLAEAFAGLHDDIRVVENRLPTEWWKGLSSRRRRGSKPRVGWAGGVSHTGDLELIADVVKELAGEVEWVFFGMCPDKIRPYIHEMHVGVPIDQYPSMLASLDLDLALAPLEQNLFNECKSNLRLLEYGACGFPVICSDLVCYRGDLPVMRVKNRFRDWVDAIRMHISDLDAAAQAGDRLREAVHRDWMLEGESLERWRKAWMPH